MRRQMVTTMYNNLDYSSTFCDTGLRSRHLKGKGKKALKPAC